MSKSRVTHWGKLLIRVSGIIFANKNSKNILKILKVAKNFQTVLLIEIEYFPET